MKEFILLPKHTYDSIKQVSSSSSSEKRSDVVNSIQPKGQNKNAFKTTVPPPPIPLRQIPIPEKHNNDSENDNRSYKVNTHTSVNDILSFRFEEEKLKKAQILLNYFKNNLNYKWDRKGDIHSPNNNRNILDIITDFLNEKKSLANSDITYYKYIVYTSNMPLSLINNKSLKKSLETTKRTKSTRVGGKLLKKIKRYNHHTNWKTY